MVSAIGLHEVTEISVQITILVDVIEAGLSGFVSKTS